MLRSISVALLILWYYLSAAQLDQGSALINKGVSSAMQSDYYQAALHYEQAKEYYLDIQNYHNYLECEFLLLDCLLKRSDFGAYAQRLSELRKFIADQKVHLRPTFLDTVTTTLALFEIEYLGQTGDIVRSIVALKALYAEITTRNTTQPSVYYDQRLIQITGKLAALYGQQGDCESSQAFSAQSISAMEPYRSDYLRDGAILQPYRTLARCYGNAGDVSGVQQTFNKMRGLLSEIGNKKSQRAFDILPEIFDFYLRTNELDSAYVYLQRIQKLDNADQHQAATLQLTGDYYKARGDNHLAKQAFLKARTVILRQQGVRHEAMARCDLALGNLYLHIKEPEQALSYFHRSLFNMSDQTETPEDVSSNPPLSALSSLRDILEIIQGKAIALNTLYKATHEQKYLQSAWWTIRLGTHFMQNLRNSYSGDTDKTLLIEDSYPVFELALTIAHTLLTLTHDEHWIDSAFVLMEESKALNLRDAVLHTQGRRFAGIPDSLLQYENTLRVEISGKERLLGEYRNSEHYQENIEVRYLNELAVKKEQYRRLIARYEREHPEYYALKHKPTAISVADIRSALLPGQTMLEYFIGDSSIYLLVVGFTEKQLFQIPKNFPLETWVTVYRNALHEFSSDKSMQSLSAYAQVASDLFEKLIPSELKLDSSLLIIPDGVLGYLSFSSLLNTLPQDLNDIRGYDFLLWYHDISYAYSANLSLELRTESSHSSGNALILAPQFEGLDDIPPLTFNQSEARTIRTLTGGYLLAGPGCTIPAFHRIVDSRPFNILHLATHGSADDASGDASFLVFSGSDRDSALLYARDLYNLDLPLDLVYLSACETGTGELRRGEGIISLARGFFYAGVKSLVTTLWRVEDSRSALLSENFYRGIRKGMRKDLALSSAQRNYLKSISPADKIFAHPVYWSALIPVGNMHAIELSSQTHFPLWIKILFVSVSIVFLGLLVLRLRR